MAGDRFSFRFSIRLHKLVTVPKSLIRRRLGVINECLEKEVKEKLMKLFFED
ncbi:hypothetical protein SAMN05444380_103161 [Thermophagus xiamenensis]|uniref:Uncharacterized protein n=1 Tax=Thermophagus xiamenensis TaxID=385682 RepID=A0A1I1W095_9BACT|nr:hypothetical protein SAMN05444380_103161 [Thermophagus xiamenensis]